MGDLTPQQDQRKEIDLMARIIVTTERSKRPDAPVLLDKRVHPEHLSDERSGATIIERFVVEHARTLSHGRLRGSAMALR